MKYKQKSGRINILDQISIFDQASDFAKIQANFFLPIDQNFGRKLWSNNKILLN